MKKILISWFMVVIIAPLLFAFAHPNKIKYEAMEGKTVNISGLIRMVGNEPFTELVIEDASGTLFQIAGERKKELWKLQGATLELQGKIVNQPSRYTQFLISVDTFHNILKDENAH